MLSHGMKAFRDMEESTEHQEILTRLQDLFQRLLLMMTMLLCQEDLTMAMEHTECRFITGNILSVSCLFVPFMFSINQYLKF